MTAVDDLSKMIDTRETCEGFGVMKLRGTRNSRLSCPWRLELYLEHKRWHL